MKDYEAGLLKWIAEQVCDELYSLSKSDHKIMVNNWLAFATLATYREAASILDTIIIPSIDDCMSGLIEPPGMAENPKWQQMKEWHSEHWHLSQFDCMEAEYEPYITITELHLPHFTLSL